MKGMENFKLEPLTKLDENSSIIGFNDYLKSLEKHYFSEVSLRNYRSKDKTTHMSIDMKCNLSLLEMLGLHNKGRWGDNDSEFSPLKKSFDLLRSRNTVKLDIEELTLFLNDTSIVIKKIYNLSIAEQFNEILLEIANHYIYFSKGLTEKPYEIFVPVFEDNLKENDRDQALSEAKHEKTPKNYFEFWGVYFDSQEDALVYDLSRNTYITAHLELHMLDD